MKRGREEGRGREEREGGGGAWQGRGLAPRLEPRQRTPATGSLSRWPVKTVKGLRGYESQGVGERRGGR